MKFSIRYLGWLALSAALYSILLYMTPRSEFGSLLLLTGSLFGLYALWMGRRSPQWLLPSLTPSLTGAWIIGGGLMLRFLAFWALPQLSDDYFRFIWDGQLWNLGINPFRYLPSDLIANTPEVAGQPLSQILFEGMNSPNYFTIYPPVLQGIFWAAAYLSPNDLLGAIWILKLPILLAEAGTLWLLLKLLPRMGLARWHVSWYAFNPLVIIELSGNLHFEALLIFFSLWSVYLLQQDRWWQSALVFALAICCKLLPVIWLPLLIRRLGWKKAILFGLISGLGTLLLFLPMFDQETLLHLSESVGLYFQTFEFNASIWYLVRAIGYAITGYNLIQYAGPLLALVTLFLILLYTFLERQPTIQNLPQGMLWVLFTYFMLASIVHPWYVSTLVLLAVFSRFRWPMVWSGLAFLTYLTYAYIPYTESLWLVAVEYVGVLGWLGYELFVQGRHPHQKDQVETY